MGADHEVVVALLDDEVVHRNARQIGVGQRPAEAAIHAHVQAAVGAAEQQAVHIGGFGERVDGLHRQAAPGASIVAEPGPARACILGDVEVGGKVVVPVAVEGGVEPVGFVVGPEDLGDPEGAVR